jgi:Leucine-rich repeat (LRR) protein
MYSNFPKAYVIYLLEITMNAITKLRTEERVLGDHLIACSELTLKQLCSRREARFNRCPGYGVASPSAIRRLNQDAVELSKMLTNRYYITHLSLRNCFLKKTAVREVIKALIYNKTLLNLDLSSNLIGDEGVKVLPEVLGSNSTLQTLLLQDCEIGNAGAKSIAIALENNSTLKVLDLSLNLIGATGIQWLVSQLAANRTLSSFNIRGNLIGIDGLLAIGVLLDWNCSIEELDIADSVLKWSESLEPSPEGTFIVAHMSAARQNAVKSSLQRVYCGCLIPDRELILDSLLGVNIRRKGPVQLDEPRFGQKTFDFCNMGLSEDNWPQSYRSALIFESATTVSLCGNQLRSIPTHIINIDLFSENYLGSISMTNNRLEGTLTNRILHLPRLRIMDLSQNSLTGLPPEIALLTALEVLDLRWNKIANSGLPIDLFTLTSLRHLKLQRNPIDSISEEVFKMTRLTNFQLTGTFVPMAQRCVFECWSDKKFDLDLSSARLQALPRNIRYLVNLQRLDLHDNELVSLPLEISLLNKLVILDVRFNSLNNLPWSLGEMKCLQTLLLEGNPLLNLPAELLNKDISFIKSFLLSLKEGQVACNRLKLMVSF